ncbi:hypothetical protein [Ancylobacter sp. G4_0304]|uniref:hypothetical protein n=1 Tax=Ancylobacter sp. G4_0304 TaxID=3114289 RepID=UPI0039C67891
MTARFAWTHHPVGCSVQGRADKDIHAEIWLPAWEGRGSRYLTIKLTRPGYAAEYSSAPTIEAAKARAEEMLTEAEGMQ